MRGVSLACSAVFLELELEALRAGASSQSFLNSLASGAELHTRPHLGKGGPCEPTACAGGGEGEEGGRVRAPPIPPNRY